MLTLTYEKVSSAERVGSSSSHPSKCMLCYLSCTARCTWQTKRIVCGPNMCCNVKTPCILTGQPRKTRNNGIRRTVKCVSPISKGGRRSIYTHDAAVGHGSVCLDATQNKKQKVIQKSKLLIRSVMFLFCDSGFETTYARGNALHLSPKVLLSCRSCRVQDKGLDEGVGGGGGGHS